MPLLSRLRIPSPAFSTIAVVSATLSSSSCVRCSTKASMRTVRSALAHRWLTSSASAANPTPSSIHDRGDHAAVQSTMATRASAPSSAAIAAGR